MGQEHEARIKIMGKDPGRYALIEEGMKSTIPILVILLAGCGGESEPQTPKTKEIALEVDGMFKAGSAT